jgi:outer membrane biosynthesis protein TonB
MSDNPPAQYSQKPNRRCCPRLTCEQLTYVDFGVGIGGIVIDLSEQGLRFHAVRAVNDGQNIHLKFRLPGDAGYIEAIGKVAWLNDSGKGGGLRFVELDEQGRKQVSSWISAWVPAKLLPQRHDKMNLSGLYSLIDKVPPFSNVAVSARSTQQFGRGAADAEVKIQKPKSQSLSSVPNLTVQGDVRPSLRDPSRVTKPKRKASEEPLGRNYRFLVMLSVALGCLLVLAAVIRVHLIRLRGSGVANHVLSAPTEISLSDASNSTASQASHAAQPEAASVSRAAPDGRDLPKRNRRTVFRSAVLLERVEPIYPLSAKQQHLAGAVQIKATIAKDGVPHVLTFVSGEQTLAGAAMDAISLWRYRPALLNGEPVESQIDITVNFEYKP